MRFRLAPHKGRALSSGYSVLLVSDRDTTRSQDGGARVCDAYDPIKPKELRGLTTNLSYARVPMFYLRNDAVGLL